MICCVPKSMAKSNKFNAKYHSAQPVDKFWSHQDSRDTRISTTTLLNYEEETEKLHKYDVRYHLMVPRYTNQIYGWLPGYKIRFLQCCDKNIYEGPALHKVTANLLQHDLKIPEFLTDHYIV